MLRAFLSILFILVAAHLAANGDAAAGAASYPICIACHGANGEGNPALNAPKLAGQEAWYLTRQLTNFKAGIRGTVAGDTYGMQMRPMAMTLADDTAIANVVAHIQTLPVTKPAASVTGDVVLGEGLYGLCAACHGKSGEGVEALGGPALAGQNDWYLINAIKSFQAGRRGTHADDTYGAQMKPMAATLASEAAMNNVVAYINTLE